MRAKRNLKIENLERREVFSANPLAAPVDVGLAAGEAGVAPAAPSSGSTEAMPALLSAEIVLIGTHHEPTAGPAGEMTHYQQRMVSSITTMAEGESCGV